MVRQESAKLLCVGSIPTPASNFFSLQRKDLEKSEGQVSAELSVKSLTVQNSAVLADHSPTTR